MRSRKTVAGFVFDLKRGGRLERVRLQGSGGLLGDGALAALNAEDTKLDPHEVAGRLLRKAQEEHRRTGEVRRAYPWLRYDRRIQPTDARPVACWVVFEGENQESAAP